MGRRIPPAALAVLALAMPSRHARGESPRAVLGTYSVSVLGVGGQSTLSTGDRFRHRGRAEGPLEGFRTGTLSSTSPTRVSWPTTQIRFRMGNGRHRKSGIFPRRRTGRFLAGTARSIL